jgi:short-subunit dehydrogenase
MSQILILGASSDIAKALAHKFGQNGHNLYLAGRNLEELNIEASNLQIRYGIKAKAFRFDALAYSSHQLFYSSLKPKPEGLIFAVGYLGDQKTAQKNFDEFKLILDTNFTGVVSICNLVANDYYQNKKGFIIGISSVAGERGRKSNYAYGSAKAALTTYLSGLRARMSTVGVPVITVKPGFVRTHMTAALDLPKLLTASPDEVAADIYQAWQKSKNQVYTKWFWRYIMLIIRFIPENIFKKLNF